MSEEFDIFIKIFDSLGTFGLLTIIVLALFRGWVIPVYIQSKIDNLHNSYFKEITDLHDEIHLLQQKRIETLEMLAKEREARVEQGVQMLSIYIETQDKLSRLADQLKEGHHD